MLTGNLKKKKPNKQNKNCNESDFSKMKKKQSEESVVTVYISAEMSLYSLLSS